MYRYSALKVGANWLPFSFDGHEYLRELYCDPQPIVILEKAAQMGASIVAINRALHFVDTTGGTVIYFFPTDTDVADFSNTRVKPMIERCEYLSDQCNDINNVHVRQIGMGLLYFRGMFAKGRTKSIPADFTIFDELDEAKPEHKAQALERMSHSAWGWRMELSTPTIPDYGIDIEFAQSDQRYWHVACGCREGVVLEDVFPECIGVRHEGTDREEVFLRCPRCGKIRLNPCEYATVGEYRGWIPKRPENARHARGYHLSQLFSTTPACSPAAIWYKFRHTRDIPEFYNSVLGVPYAGDRMPLTLDVLAKCHGDWGLAQTGTRCYIGIDQGADNYVIVKQRDPNTGAGKVINAVVVEGPNPWPATVEICKLYPDAAIVVDALPEKTQARALCQLFPGRAYMCYYTDTQKDAVVVDDDPNEPDAGMKVTVHRTETLDRVIEMLLWTAQGRPDGIILPNAQLPICKEIKDHLAALAKIRRRRVVNIGGVQQETGEVEWVYVHIKPDHFAHALNYATIAESVPVNVGWAGFM